MLAFFGILQTGHESRKTSQSLQEQRCLQGSITTQEFRELQHLQTIALFSSSPFSVFSSFSSMFWQQDSASSAALADKQADSLSRWIVLFNDATIASFSFATLCHVWFSISILFKKFWSSIVLFAAFEISSSFCLSRSWVLDSYFFIKSAICCFLCSCNANLNLSFCFKENKNKGILKIDHEKINDLIWIYEW